MATGNRSPRNPGQIQRFTGVGQIASTPDYVVPQGEAASALTALAGGVAGRLKQMAIRAAASEGEAAGLNAGQRAGAGYLQQQGAIAAADPDASTRKINAAMSAYIDAAARKHGVDAGTLRLIASLESGGDPRAQNPNSSAGGLFQFTDGTAGDYGLADRFDPAQASDAAARLLKDNAAHLTRVLGRAPTPAELYLAHQQGAGGAEKLLTNPGARAADIVGADAVTLNGGTANMTAGEFAGLWLGKAGGKAPAAVVPPPTGGLNPQPLSLRNDNTVYGDAFDAAAIKSFGWRMQEGVGNEIAAAYDQFKDDPAAWQQAIGQIHERYAGDPNLGAPELREAFDRTFAERSAVYSRDVLQRQETRLMQEQASAYSASFDTTVADLERQAYILGANPEAEAALGGQAARLLAQIGTAEADNIITPAQAAAQREQVNTTLASARVQGVFASLETPAQQEAFASNLLAEWAENKGPMAGMPLATVKAMSQTLYSQARANQNQQTAQTKAEAGRVQGLIADDLASIAATGKGIDVAANGITPDRLAALGMDPEKWASDRDFAMRGWQATSGMELETPAELNDRLAALAPVPGSPGYAEQAQIHAAAAQQAQAVLKERETDPLGQAVRAGLVALEPVDPSSPDSLALRRQQANQVASVYGTPVSYFRPEERTALTAALYQQPELMPGFALGVVKAFGDEAPKALSEISDAGPELAYAAGITAETGNNGVITEISRVIAGRRDKSINVKLPGDAVMANAAGAVLGSALAGNPATRAAVVNVAQILFEGQAAAMGFDPGEVKEPGSAAFNAWQQSVNRALGARTVNGVQYGGLTSVNGGQTVAPAGMEAGRLQQLVSTFSPEDLAALPPVGTGNGVPVAAWQLQGAQLVAVGDGQYRVALGDPNGLEPQYLTQPGGGYWLLDAKALDAARQANPPAPSAWDALFNPAGTAVRMAP